MRREREIQRPTSAAGEGETSEVSLPQLVASVYESASPVERSRLLEHLMRPLGILSLAGVANGIFSKIQFLSGGSNSHIRPEDAAIVRVEDVVALVDFVQQASGEVVSGLTQLLSDSPAMSATAAATLLISVIQRRRRKHHADTDSRSNDASERS